jgi:peptide/nickel transport system substrate-binding protein
MMGSLPEGEVIKQDMAKAKEHLAACKYDMKTMDIELSWVGEVPLEERFALLMQANFSQLGIKATVKKVPWALFVDRVSKPENTPNISQVFVNTTTGDPDSLIYAMYDSKHSGTWMAPEYLKDPKVDEMLAKGREVSDQAERIKIYQELNRYLKDISPSIYGMDQIAVFAATNKVSVPALSDPSKAFALAGFGFNFRLMEMKD